jgi:hypothetical protein
MTPQERKQRHLAARPKRLREAAPNDFPNILTGDEMLAQLGWKNTVRTMSEATLAALNLPRSGAAFRG